MKVEKHVWDGKVELKATFGGLLKTPLGVLSKEEANTLVKDFQAKLNNMFFKTHRPYYIKFEVNFKEPYININVAMECEYRYIPTPEEWEELRQKAVDTLNEALTKLDDLIRFAKQQKWVFEIFKMAEEKEQEIGGK